MSEAESNASLGVVDYVIIAAMLLLSASIGVYYRCTGGKQKTTREYLLADGNMSIVPVSFSVVVSLFSAITILGLSSEIYSFGTMYLIVNVGYVFGILIKTYCFLPVFYNLQTTSIYEYLERRFGVTTRTAASCAFSFQMILFNSVVLYAPSLALSSVTGISLSGSVISVGLVCTFYSVLGGMKAVLITDAFQAITMLIALVSIVVKGIVDAGGSSEMWRIAQEGGRIQLFDFNPNPTLRHTFWTLVVGGGFNYLIAFAVNQAQVQRLMTVNSLKKSQQAVWLSYIILVTIVMFTGFSGLVIYARYFDCDPIKQGRIYSFDQILPIFVMDSMSHIPGLAGLFIACIFSAALSTISSTLNSLAAVTIEDYLKPILKHCRRQDLSDGGRNAILSQTIAMFYGFLAIGLAFVVGDVSGLLQITLTIFGVIGGPILGLFSLGMFFWIANETGALSGLASGLAISMWIGFGHPKPPLPRLTTRVDGCKTIKTLAINTTLPVQNNEEEFFYLYRISYLWYGVIGLLVTLLVGVAVSAATQAIWPNKKLDPHLFSPAVCRFLPTDTMIERRTQSTDEIEMDTVRNSSREIL